MSWSTNDHLIRPDMPLSGPGSAVYLAETVKKTTELFIAKSQNSNPEPFIQNKTEFIEPVDLSQLATSTYYDIPLGNASVPRFSQTEVRVINETTTSAIELIVRAHPQSKVICHNMGRYRDPRSDWSKSIYGQENDFLHRTTLSASLTPSIYPLHWCQAVYSRGVTIIRGPGTLGWPFLHPDKRTTFDVVTMTPHIYNKPIEKFDDNDLAIVRTKLEIMLSVCVMHGADVVVLGAFGCGGARNPPELVSAAFKSVIEEFAGYFSHIYFVIYGNNPLSLETVRIFAKNLVGMDAVDIAAAPLGGTLAFNSESTRKKTVKVYKAEAPWVIRDRVIHKTDSDYKTMCPDGGLCTKMFEGTHSKEAYHPPHCTHGPGCCIANKYHKKLFIHDAKVWDALREAEVARISEIAWAKYHALPRVLKGVFPQKTRFLPQLSLMEYSCLSNEENAIERKLIPSINVSSVSMDTTLPIGQTEKKHLVKWCRAAGFKKIYDSYNCGFSPEEFHKRCDGVAPTLVLIQANSESGVRLFGGYTGIPWQSSGPTPRGIEAHRGFVFTLKNTNGMPPTAFPIAPNYKNSITFDKSSGPIFGTSTIRIMGRSSISSITDDYMVSNNFNFTESQTTTFEVLCYEVFQVLNDEDLQANQPAQQGAPKSQPSGFQFFPTPGKSGFFTFGAPKTTPQQPQNSVSPGVLSGSFSSTPPPPSQARNISTNFLKTPFTSTYFDIVD